MKRQIARAVKVAIFASSGLAPLAEAQQTAIEEIVVTAQRREQNIQDVGVSISAVSGDNARALGVFNSTDIAKIAPGVSLNATSGGNASVALTIRGVSQSDFSVNQEAPNSLYVDDVYVSSPGALAFPLYDINRIEVLRGPQGTLFGRASSGGLAHFITNRPSEGTEGYLDAGIGNYNSYYVEGAVGGSLTDTVQGRLAGRYERGDGWFENGLPGGEDAYETNFYGLRGQLAAELTPSLSARLAVSYDKRPSATAGAYRSVSAFVDETGHPAVMPADLDVYGTGPGNDFTGYRNPYREKRKGDFNNVGYIESEKLSPTLYLDWRIGSVNVASITNYTTLEGDYNEDVDSGPVDFAQSPISQEFEQYSQEFRATAELDRLTWTAGVFYLNTDHDFTTEFVFPALAGSDFAYSNLNAVKQQLESIAAFGQIEYEITDTVTGTVGLRYTHDEKEFDSRVYFYELGNGYFGGTGSEVFDPPAIVYDFRQATVGDLARESEGLWSGKVALDYRPTDTQLFYGSISRGVKGPGFNTNAAANLTNEETPFDSESLIAYEIGSKSEFLGRTLRLNVGAFYYDYSDFQGFAFNGLQGVVGNYDGTFKGAEVEFMAVPGDGWLVSLGVSYLDSELEDVPTVYDGVRDQQSIMAPEWTANGTVRKEIAVGSNSLALQWTFDYVSERYASIDNNLATYVPGSTGHNARVSYLLAGPNIEIAAWVNNVFDEDRLTFSYDLISSTGALLTNYSEPRMFGVSVRKSF